MQKYILLLALLAAVVGCRNRSAKLMTVDITILNNSTNRLDWVELKWEGPEVPGGILSTGISKTTIEAEWNNWTNASIAFVDAETRTPYEIHLSFPGVNAKVRSGQCNEVLIRILSYSAAEVVCR